MQLKSWIAAIAVAGSAFSAGDPAPAQQTGPARFTTAEEVRPILEATRGNWVALREYEGQDWLYVTQLFTMRCALLGMGVGINGQKPVAWQMPDCHYDAAAPYALLEGDPLPSQTFPLGSVQRIDVLLLLIDGSTLTGSFTRDAVKMP